MKISEKGINLIKFYESCRLKAYKCPSGIWTIGWGHTQNVKENDTWTQQQADNVLLNDLIEREAVINYLKLNLTQNQFDALVSLVYNIGSGRFQRSPVRAQIIVDANHPWIRTAFLKHVYDNKGNRLPGLVARRNKEIELYFS
jgi:lysozyme